MWVTCAHLGGREPVAALLHRAEVLEQDVGLLAQVAEPAPAVRRVQVDDRAALVGIAVEKRQRTVRGSDIARKGRMQSAGITAGWLDLDHVSAEVGEQSSGKRTTQVGE